MPGVSGNAQVLRRLNGIAVLRALHEAESMTFADLTSSTSLSRPTVEDAMGGLIEEGLAVEVSPTADGRRSVGRPAKRYQFRTDAGYVLGADISVRSIRVLAADLRGTLLATTETTVDPGLPAADRLDVARRAVKDALLEAEIRKSDLWTIGVATTGIIDPAGRVTKSTRLADWAGTDVATALRGISRADVVVGNDARLAALAEHWLGAATDVSTFVNILAGTTTAAGVVIDGEVYHGRNGASGEIGVLAESGWQQAVDALGNEGGAELFRRAAGGDRRALAATQSFTHHLAPGVAALVLAFDPDCVVIAGELSGVGEALTAPLEAYLESVCLFPPEVRSSKLGPEAAALGAVRLALDRVESRLFDLDRR